MPLEVNPHSYDSSHTKTFILLQCHFGQLPLPSTDYNTDTKSVLDQAIRILQVSIVYWTPPPPPPRDIHPAAVSLWSAAPTVHRLQHGHQVCTGSGHTYITGWFSVRTPFPRPSPYKTCILLLCHFGQLPLPSTDYNKDTKSVLDQAIRILQVGISAVKIRRTCQTIGHFLCMFNKKC